MGCVRARSVYSISCSVTVCNNAVARPIAGLTVLVLSHAHWFADLRKRTVRSLRTQPYALPESKKVVSQHSAHLPARAGKCNARQGRQRRVLALRQHHTCKLTQQHHQQSCSCSAAFLRTPTSATLRVYGVAAALPWSVLRAALAKLRRHKLAVLYVRLAQRRHMQAPVSHRTLAPVLVQ